MSNLPQDEQSKLLNEWEAKAKSQLAERAAILDRSQATLPQDLTLAEAILTFLSTLKGQSPTTVKTYRVGCRRFMWFIYSTERGRPTEVAVFKLSPLILEDFYLWMVDTYGRKARATIGSYLAGTRNLFEYLAQRRLTPSGCQYQEMVARLGKLQGRASYKTPRIRTKQIEQVARLAANPSPIPASDSGESDEHKGKVRIARSQDEVKRQRQEELRDRAIILTLFVTGMRRQEVANLDREEIETILADRAEKLCKADNLNPAPSDSSAVGSSEEAYELIITGKGQKERIVYFDEASLSAIAEYLKLRGKDAYRPLFLQHHRGRDRVKPGAGGEAYRVSLVAVWRVVSKYAKLVGVEIKPHDFRHNLATTMLNAGAQLSVVQDVLGHASPTTTKQIYAHYDKAHIKQAVSQYRKSATEL